MKRLLRKPFVLLLLCSLIVLAGCQHPLAPAIAGRQMADGARDSVDAQGAEPTDYTMEYTAPAFEWETCALDLGSPPCPAAKDQPPVVVVQKKSDCLTCQLGDALVLVLKTFSGR